ncbi:MAG: hypothetical protein EOO96_24320 [Pedobacter sp.]|nr:MAG: hypothetical protein EOO96_24320 [Pedobacter sp.]
MIGVFFNSLAQVPFALIQADGKVKLTSLLHVTEFFIYIVMLTFLGKYFGLLGVAIAFLLRALIDLLILKGIANTILYRNVSGSKNIGISFKLFNIK